MIWPVETPRLSPWRTERTKVRSAGVSAAAEHALQRVVRGQAHPLLLQREAQLVAERPLEPLRGHVQRREEAQACLERHDEQVDQLGQLVARSAPCAGAPRRLIRSMTGSIQPTRRTRAAAPSTRTTGEKSRASGDPDPEERLPPTAASTR